MELSAVFVYLRTVSLVVAANLLSDVIASVKSRCFNIHTYIHTYIHTDRAIYMAHYVDSTRRIRDAD